jgi:hypothetical protein
MILETSNLSYARGQFRRCGILQNAEEVLTSFHWDNIDNQDWLEYESFDGASRYTIFI